MCLEGVCRRYPQISFPYKLFIDTKSFLTHTFSSLCPPSLISSPHSSGIYGWCPDYFKILSRYLSDKLNTIQTPEKLSTDPLAPSGPPTGNFQVNILKVIGFKHLWTPSKTSDKHQSTTVMATFVHT